MWARCARWFYVAGSLGVAAMLAASCGSDGYSLSVDLRTDLLPATEFGTVVTESSGADPQQHGATESALQYITGARVADFTGLADGDVMVTVRLLDPEGSELVSRITHITLKQDYALTVVVTRSCAGVVCPGPMDDPHLTTCQAGVCTSPDCTIDTPQNCPAPECATLTDCRTEISCLVPLCDHGVCLFSPNDALCDPGKKCNPTDGCVLPEGGPCTPTSAHETDCNNHVDDDCDGRIDCLDEDCAGQPCEDGDACTQGETCQSSACSGGQPIPCDDQNPCTDDACDPQTGCTHANNTAACDDGDPCTTGDTCSGGTCMPGGTTACDDQNPCTDDACDAQTGCTHTDNTAPCDDGDTCTTGDTCSGGACLPGSAKSCDDGNGCTDDTCDPLAGCKHANNTAPCDDGIFCNGADHCQGGTCSVHPGSPCTQACDEANNVCVGCLTDPDCGPVTTGAWGSCGGFADACDTSGTQSRTVTTPHCTSGVCTSTPSTETQACTRVTNGNVCGAVTLGSWSTCGSFSSTCDESGTQTRSVTTPTCSGGSCSNVVTMDSQSCTRNTDGTSCGTTTYGTWSSCGGFSSTCDTTGTKSRTVTTFSCSAGACASSQSTDTQSCTRTVTNGTSCGGGSYCCSGSCVSKSSNSHCGSCGIVCGGGYTCGQPISGQWGCHCASNSGCVNDGYGTGATCYQTWCNCQCACTEPCTCGNRCAGGATCHEVYGQNYCSYP